MWYDPETHHRRSIRLKGYDYSQPGYYYVTICTQDRVERFGEVQNDKMNLNEAGEMVDMEWNRIRERYVHVVLDEYRIMPNHMHGILQITIPADLIQAIDDPGTVERGLVPLRTDEDESIEPVVGRGDKFIGIVRDGVIEPGLKKTEEAVEAIRFLRSYYSK